MQAPRLRFSAVQIRCYLLTGCEPANRFADGSPGGLSSSRNESRSIISCGFNCFSKPSGMSDKLLFVYVSISSRNCLHCPPGEFDDDVLVVLFGEQAGQ